MDMNKNQRLANVIILCTNACNEINLIAKFDGQDEMIKSIEQVCILAQKYMAQ